MRRWWDVAGAILIGVAVSHLSWAPESDVSTDCGYWERAFNQDRLLNVLDRPLRVAPYHARWWDHQGVFACQEIPARRSDTFHGFIELGIEYLTERGE